MLINTIRVILILNISIFGSISLADENKVRYEKAQNLIDEYSGNADKLKQAVELLKEIQKQDQNSKYALTGLGRVYYKAGYINYDNYDQEALKNSRTMFEKAISLYPNFFDAYYYGTYAYLFSKTPSKARQLALSAQKISPNSAKVDLLLAEISKSEKNYDAVITHANSAIKKGTDKKTLVDAYGLLSTAYKMLDKYDLAEAAYIKIIDLEPKSAWARSNYSSFVRRYMKNYDLAIEQGKAALEMMDFGMGHTVLADAYYEKGANFHWSKREYESAIKFYSLAISHNPSHSKAYYGQGMAYFNLGYQTKNIALLENAKTALEKTIQLNPKHPKAATELNKVIGLIGSL